MISRGWKRRQEDARERFSAEDQERAQVRAARAALYEQQRLAALEQVAETARANACERVSCPVCDAGSLTIAQAEVVIRALERLPAASQPDEDVLMILRGIAERRAEHTRTSLPLRHGLSYPRAADPGPAAETAHITPREEPVSAPKRKAVKVDPPWLDAGAVEEDD